MEFDPNDYDVEGIKGYFNEMKKEQEDYYGTAAMNGLDYAMVDLINVGNEYDTSGMSDYEVALMAYNMGILENFRIGRKY